eukprot:SAG31_NODE_326_length_17664_cov_10.038543_7_plen_182_part_00
MPRGKAWQPHEDSALRELLKDGMPSDPPGWQLIAEQLPTDVATWTGKATQTWAWTLDLRVVVARPKKAGGSGWRGGEGIQSTECAKAASSGAVLISRRPTNAVLISRRPTNAQPPAQLLWSPAAQPTGSKGGEARYCRCSGERDRGACCQQRQPDQETTRAARERQTGQLPPLPVPRYSCT